MDPNKLTEADRNHARLSASRVTIAEMEEEAHSKKLLRHGSNSMPGAVAVVAVEEPTNTKEPQQQIHMNLQDGLHPDETEEPSVSPVQQEENAARLPSTSSTAPPTAKSTNISSSYDQDENDGVLPMVTAELVLAPIHAVQVTIDDETDPEEAMSPPAANPQRASSSSNHNRESTRTEETTTTTTKSSALLIKLGPVILVVLLIAIIVALLIALLSELSEEDAASVILPSSGDCFSDTVTLYFAQLYGTPSYTEQNGQGRQVYVLCPGTHIQVGSIRLPSEDNNLDELHSSLADQHSPLGIALSNIRIQCGADGSSANNCVLDGGGLHVVQMPYDDQHPTDHVTIQGFTFRGQVWSNSMVQGTSVLLDYPGLNIRFEDCHWRDMTAHHGVVRIGSYDKTNALRPGRVAEAHQVEVTFSDCSFQDIVYRTPLLQAVGQTLTLENVRVDRLSLDRTDLSCTGERLGEIDCHMFLFCDGTSVCTMDRLQVQDVEYRSAAAVVVASAQANLTVRRDNPFSKLQVRWANPNTSLRPAPCPSGVARYEPTFRYFECQSMDGETTCFSSTASLNAAHLIHRERTVFVLCANHRIGIGELFNAPENDFRMVRGDEPLMITRSNVHVQCGTDGSLHNNCVLDGGTFHVLMHPHPPLFEFDEDHFGRVDNVTLRGLTFTGRIVIDPVFGGGSIVVSNHGDVAFTDCLWTDIETVLDLVFVGSNAHQELTEQQIANHTVSLSISDSTFRHTTHSLSLVMAHAQALSLSNVTFENLTMPHFLSSCDYYHYPFEGSHCHMVIMCFEGSLCSLSDVTINHVEYDAYAPVLYTDDSQLFLEGRFGVDHLCRRNDTVDDNDGMFGDNIDEACPSGVARMGGQYPDTSYKCRFNGIERNISTVLDWCRHYK